MFSKAQSGASSIEDTLWVCSQSTTWLTRNFSNGRLQGFPAEADAIQADPPIESSSNKALIHRSLEEPRAVRRQGHLLLFRKVKAHCTDKSLDTRENNRADTLAELGRRTDIPHLSQSPLGTIVVPDLAVSLLYLSAHLPPPRHDHLGGVTYGIDRLQHQRNLCNDFLPGDGSLLINLPARLPSPHTPRRHAYYGDAESDTAPIRLRSRPVRSPVRPHRRMRDYALDPQVQKKRRLVAGCPDAMELVRPPAK